MSAAQEALGESSTSFNAASGQLSLLTTQLNSDFARGSSYYENEVDKLRKEAYAGAAGIAGGPFGLLVSYSIASGVVEGKLVPELNKKFAEVQQSFKNIRKLVAQANVDINNAKGNLQNEIHTIGEIKSQTETTKMWVELDDLMLSLLKESAGVLIKQCKDYIKNHS